MGELKGGKGEGKRKGRKKWWGEGEGREGRGRERGNGKGKGGDPPKGWFTPPMFEILKNTLQSAIGSQCASL